MKRVNEFGTAVKHKHGDSSFIKRILNRDPRHIESQFLLSRRAGYIMALQNTFEETLMCSERHINVATVTLL